MNSPVVDASSNAQVAGEFTEKSCSYCGINDPNCLVFCSKAKRWFCNKTQKELPGSDIFIHLLLACSSEVKLCRGDPQKDMPLQCDVCGSRNIFQLEFGHKTSGSIWFNCQTGCGSLHETVNYQGINQSSPIIKGRQFNTTLVRGSTDRSTHCARQISFEEICRLEELWAENPNATINDAPVASCVENLEKLIIRNNILRNCKPPCEYKSVLQYYQTFYALLQIEALEDDIIKEPVRMEHVRIYALDNLYCQMGFVHIPQRNDGSEADVELGEEITIKPLKENSSIQPLVAKITELPNDVSDVMCFEHHSKVYYFGSHMYFINLQRRPIRFRRMKRALQNVLLCPPYDSRFLTPLLIDRDTENFVMKEALPIPTIVPGLKGLDESQDAAVSVAMKQRITLIQTPPGTGKLITAASIVYHMCSTLKRKVLAVAPSQAAVDHLCEKISETGLNVLLICTRSMEDVPTNVKKLMINQRIHGSIYQFERYCERFSISFDRTIMEAEAKVLREADVICCTCITAGQERFKYFNFQSVLIMDSTQAMEPECLIPITKGCRHLVLLGDPCQIGPVIKSKKAAEAGLERSLFERLLRLRVPSIRLKVQHRMHPALSSFSNGVFYENDLESGDCSTFSATKIDFPWPDPDRPTFFYCQAGQEKVKQDGSSFANRNEAIAVQQIITKLLKCGVKRNEIGVIVPNEGQRNLLTKKLCHLAVNVQIITMDESPYVKKDFIIMSCVRANKNHEIGLLNNPRCMNMALTRACQGFIIVGEPTTFSEDPFWNALLHFYSEKNLLVQGPLENLVPYELHSSKPPVPYTYRPDADFNVNKTTSE